VSMRSPDQLRTGTRVPLQLNASRNTCGDKCMDYKVNGALSSDNVKTCTENEYYRSYLNAMQSLDSVKPPRMDNYSQQNAQSSVQYNTQHKNQHNSQHNALHNSKHSAQHNTGTQHNDNAVKHVTVSLKLSMDRLFDPSLSALQREKLFAWNRMHQFKLRRKYSYAIVRSVCVCVSCLFSSLCVLCVCAFVCCCVTVL